MSGRAASRPGQAVAPPPSQPPPTPGAAGAAAVTAAALSSPTNSAAAQRGQRRPHHRREKAVVKPRAANDGIGLFRLRTERAVRRAFGALRGVSVIELHGWWRSVTNREADSRSLPLGLE